MTGVLLVIAGVVLAQGGALPARQVSARLVPPVPGVLPHDGALGAPVPAPRGAATVTTEAVSLRYTFDAGVGEPITDTTGGHELRTISQNGGELRLVPQGLGLAVAYPRRCTLARESECPRAILEGLPDDSLNPGTRPLQYGADVLMTRADLADGANVVQKGYSVGGGSQYKLQVDHLRGHPSCVIAGQRHRIYRAEAWLDVADGRWHNLTCARTANRLVMSVDGVDRAWVAVPRLLSIANSEPLRVGGKGPARNNDQFAGEIDDVFVTIG
jgi:hypothetical protein